MNADNCGSTTTRAPQRAAEKLVPGVRLGATPYCAHRGTEATARTSPVAVPAGESSRWSTSRGSNRIGPLSWKQRHGGADAWCVLSVSRDVFPC